MPGLYIFESEISKIKGALKFGMSINFVSRINQYRTVYGKRCYYLALYLLKEVTVNQIKQIESNILRKTNHLNATGYGKEWRKISYFELNTIIIDTLNEYLIKYEHISEDVMLKLYSPNLEEKKEPYNINNLIILHYQIIYVIWFLFFF